MTDNTRTAAEHSTASAKKRPNLIFAVVGIIILGAIIYWGFSQDEPYGQEPAAPVEETPVTDAAEPEPVELAPEPEQAVAQAPAELTPEPEPKPAPLPEPAISLAEADSLLTGDVQPLNGGAVIEQFVAQPNILERSTGIVDTLRQGSVPYKLLPVGRPETKFPFRDDGAGVTMDPVGFERYNGLASVVNKLDTSAAVDLYGSYESAIEEAWSLMGYPDVSFNDAVMGALALLLTAPEPDLDARLIKKEANWIYADEDLESLPPLQKQMMRMGPDNAAIIKDKARELRSALLDRELDSP